MDKTMDMASTCPVCGRNMGRGSGTFGSRLSKTMEEKKISTATLAEWVGVSPACMSNYRRDANMPYAVVLAKIARLLGVSAEWLVFGDDEPWTAGSVLELLASSGCEYQSSGDGYLVLIDSEQLGRIAGRLNELDGQ